jgi:DNA-binding HxlR family transcriptional regulator
MFEMDEDEVSEMVRVLKALADATRLKILGLLSERELSVGAIAEALKLTEPTISHHLGRLAGVDLVTMTKLGNTHAYSLNETNLRKFQKHFDVTPFEEPSVANVLTKAEAETQRILRSFVSEGRLVKIPEMLKNRRVILRWLVEQLDPVREYHEKEINTFLKRFHEDFATLRRELVDNQFMIRRDSVYWRL